MIWLELVGERGVSLQPDYPRWLIGQARRASTLQKEIGMELRTGSAEVSAMSPLSNKNFRILCNSQGYRRKHLANSKAIEESQQDPFFRVQGLGFLVQSLGFRV